MLSLARPIGDFSMDWKRGSKGLYQLVLNHVLVTVQRTSKKKMIVTMDFPRFTKVFDDTVSPVQVKEWAEDWAWEVLDNAVALLDIEEEDE